MEFAHRGGACRRKFVQAILSVHHHAILHTQARQHTRQGLHQGFVIHTEDHRFRRCGVGERTQNVEHGAETQFLANRAHIAHSRVVFLGEEEAHAHFIKQLFAQIGTLLDLHA